MTLVNVSTLKENGWTDSAIKKFLGEPDKLKKNPRYSSGSPMRLYLIERVEQVQKSEEWQDWHQKSLARRGRQSQRMQSINEGKRQALINQAKSMLEYYFPENKPSYQSVIQHWREHKQRHLLSRGKLEIVQTPDTIDECVLLRWTHNLLRHEYTNYDEVCCFLGGEIGKEQAYEALRGIVDHAISEYLESAV